MNDNHLKLQWNHLHRQLGIRQFWASQGAVVNGDVRNMGARRLRISLLSYLESFLCGAVVVGAPKSLAIDGDSKKLGVSSRFCQWRCEERVCAQIPCFFIFFFGDFLLLLGCSGIMEIVIYQWGFVNAGRLLGLSSMEMWGACVRTDSLFPYFLIWRFFSMGELEW